MKDTPVNNIDAVLNFINTVQGPPFAYASQISNAMSENGIKIDFKHLFEILTKLKDDKMCYVETDLSTGAFKYFSTFEGQLFQQNGGYTAKFLADQAYADELQRERLRVVRVDQENIVNQNRLNALTEKLVWAGWAAAGGTSLLFLMEIVKYFHLFEHCHCQ